MSWIDGILGRFDPTTPQGMQLQGLLGGLGAMGQGLAAAGAPRPLGQPGPGMADAFGAFGQGQQRAFAGAYQNADMARRMARQGDLAAATSAKPDEELTPTQRTLRSALSTLPENVRSLADPDQLGGLVVQRETQRQRPMTPAELQAAGYRPGTVVYTSDWTGGANVTQQPDTMTPEAMAQKIAIQRAGLQPQTQWTLVMGPDGQPIAKRGSNGDYVPLRTPSEGFTLGPGQQRFGADGRPVASVPEAAPPFTLSPGQIRYGADGQPLASVPDRQQTATLSPGQAVVNVQTGQVVAQAAGRPERVTLSPGQTVVDLATGQPVASAPLKPESFTLSPGQTRFGPDGKPVASGGVDPKQQQGTENTLRDEYTKLSSDFRTVQDAYKKITMTSDSGQGDLALLYSYMKILDPGSVVRESEFALAAKSGSFGEQMQGMVTRVLSGERLPETVRKGFRTEAEKVYKAQAQSFRQYQNIYRGLAMRNNANPDNVVLPFALPAGGGGATPTAPADPLGILR